MLGVNLDGVFFTYQAALRHMLERVENGDSRRAVDRHVFHGLDFRRRP